MARGDLLWTPPADLVERATMTRYMRGLDRGFESYDELWRWSVDDLEGFWASLWDFFEVEGSYDRVLGSRSMPGAEWFPGARVNYAEHILRRHPGDAIAIVHRSELRETAEIDWDHLRRGVAACATGLRRFGGGPGDRFAAYLPNIPETIVAFLATASIGAVWSS